jgi:hypothetical protein
MPTPTKPPTAQKKEAITYDAPVFTGERVESILPTAVRVMALFTGFRGTGKSTLAATADCPQNICFLDYEQKGRELHKQLGFGYYESITDTVTAKAGRVINIELFRRTWQIIESLPKDRFTVLVLDNINELQRGMEAEVKDRPARYDVDQQKALSGAWGGAWPGVHTLVSSISTYASTRGIDLVIVVSHLKPAWGNGQPLFNKFKTDGVARLHELSTLSLVMVPGVTPPTPSALVMKEQTGLVSFDPDTKEYRITRRLPLKLPQATWAAIRSYFDHPANFQSPRPGEMPTPEELEPYSPTCSRDQLQAIAAAAKAGLLESEEE